VMPRHPGNTYSQKFSVHPEFRQNWRLHEESRIRLPWRLDARRRADEGPVRSKLDFILGPLETGTKSECHPMSSSCTAGWICCALPM
jgi:hypothetical protein